MIRRSNGNIKVWSGSDKGNAVLDLNDEEVVDPAATTGSVWVEDSTGTMGVFVNEMDMAVGSEDLTLVRDGQGYMESWGSFTQAVRNGYGDEMDSSAVELLVAHDLNGGTAAITTRMTVTHEKEAHEDTREDTPVAHNDA